MVVPDQAKCQRSLGAPYRSARAALRMLPSDRRLGAFLTNIGGSTKTGPVLNPDLRYSPSHYPTSSFTIFAMSLIERLKTRPDCTVFLGSGLLTTAGACLASVGMSSDPSLALRSLQGIITGATIAAPAFLSEWQLRSHERLRQEAATRNHLIRRAMARSLARALRDAEKNRELAVLIPEGLRDQFFKMWPSLLDRCKTDDILVDDLFPLSLSEEQWDIVVSYYDDLCDPSLASRPDEFRQRLVTQETVSQQALARLLFRLPLERDNDEPLYLFGRQLEQLWVRFLRRSICFKTSPAVPDCLRKPLFGGRRRVRCHLFEGAKGNARRASRAPRRAQKSQPTNCRGH